MPADKMKKCGLTKKTAPASLLAPRHNRKDTENGISADTARIIASAIKEMLSSKRFF
jgi:hypothetical protein